MTNKEAIDYLIDPIGKGLAEHDEAVKMAVEALEKQIPKKRIWGRTATRPNVTWICPCCRNHVNSEYCRKCGQRIDWTELKNETENND